MESPLVSDTISAEPDISSFKVLYSVSLQTQTILFLAVLVNISLIWRSSTQQLLLFLSLEETLFKFPLTAQFDLDVQ